MLTTLELIENNNNNLQVYSLVALPTKQLYPLIITILFGTLKKGLVVIT